MRLWECWPEWKADVASGYGRWFKRPPSYRGPDGLNCQLLVMLDFSSVIQELVGEDWLNIPAYCQLLPTGTKQRAANHWDLEGEWHCLGPPWWWQWRLARSLQGKAEPQETGIRAPSPPSPGPPTAHMTGPGWFPKGASRFCFAGAADFGPTQGGRGAPFLARRLHFPGKQEMVE